MPRAQEMASGVANPRDAGTWPAGLFQRPQDSIAQGQPWGMGTVGSVPGTQRGDLAMGEAGTLPRRQDRAGAYLDAALFCGRRGAVGASVGGET